MPADSMPWIFITEAVLVLALLAGVLGYALFGSKDLQDRLTFNSRALNRFIKHLRSPEFLAAEAAKLRTSLRLELQQEFDEVRKALETERDNLNERLQELLEHCAALEQQLAAQGPDKDEVSEVLQATEHALADDEARQQAFRDELMRLKAVVMEQDAELQRLRERVDPSRLDSTVNELIAAQEKQRNQQQRMLREMEMCIQVLENELSDTRAKLAMMVRRLRSRPVD